MNQLTCPPLPTNSSHVESFVDWVWGLIDSDLPHDEALFMAMRASYYSVLWDLEAHRCQPIDIPIAQENSVRWRKIAERKVNDGLN